MSFEVERAQPGSEASAFYMAQILNDAREYKLSLGDMAWGEEEFTMAETRAHVDSGNTYMGRQNGELIAAATLTWEDESVWGPERGKDQSAGYIHRLAVKNGFRGHGISRKIIHWAEDQVRDAGREYLRLDCKASNEDLRRHYESLGFVAVNEPDEDSTRSVLFQKPVNSN